MKFNLVWTIAKTKQNKETAWALVAKAISVIAGVIIMIVVPRFAGVRVYGAFSLVLAYQAILGVFAGNAIQAAVAREAAADKFGDLSRDFFLEGLKLKLVFSIISGFVFVIALELLASAVVREQIWPLLLLVFVMNIWGHVVTFFESAHRLFFEAVLYFFEYATKVFFLFVFINDLSVSKLLYIFIAGYSVATLIGLFIFLRKVNRINIQALVSLNMGRSRIILKRAFHLAIASFLLIVLAKTDAIMISQMLGLEALGFYSIAYDITQQAAIVSAPIILGVMPFFVKQHTNKLLFKSVKKIAVVNLIIFGLFLLFSDLFVRLVYGEGFEIVGSIIKILGLLPLLLSLQSLLRGVLTLKDTTQQILIFNFIAVVINILLNAVLIQTFGVIGASFATITAYLVMVSLSFWYLFNHSS